MASASSDDDGHSFGSEPDFAAMSSLRLVEDDPGPSGTHVFDEIHDDAPRDFGHELEVADGERPRGVGGVRGRRVRRRRRGARARTIPDRARSRSREARGRTASARAKPRRVHADRQTTRPVLEQAREWRALAPHLRVRGARVALGAARVFGRRVCGRADGRHAARAGDARASARRTRVRAPTTTPRRGAWTRRASGGAELELRVRGREARLAVCECPLAAGAEEEVFAEDGELVETFAEHPLVRARGRRLVRAFGDGDAPSSPSPSPRERRRIAAGLPSIDPRVVIALDLAFARGAARPSGSASLSSGVGMVGRAAHTP